MQLDTHSMAPRSFIWMGILPIKFYPASILAFWFTALSLGSQKEIDLRDQLTSSGPHFLTQAGPNHLATYCNQAHSGGLVAVGVWRCDAFGNPLTHRLWWSLLYCTNLTSTTFYLELLSAERAKHWIKRCNWFGIRLERRLALVVLELAAKGNLRFMGRGDSHTTSYMKIRWSTKGSATG